MSEELSRRDFLKLGAGAVAYKLGENLGRLNRSEQKELSQPPPTADNSSNKKLSKPPPSSLEQKTIKQLPYFSVEGASPTVLIDINSELVANNGPDAAGNDHKNPLFPKSAAWLVAADPGHYRVDNLSKVTDPQTRITIERDIRNGAAFAGDDYKDVLLTPQSEILLWEAGGGAILTGAQMEIVFSDGKGNPVKFQLGRQENHNWVVVLANGLPRDQIQGTDNNRLIDLTNYDPGFTMWQGIPPGLFVSAQFVAQTIADAHGSYRDRSTSPGQGQDGVESVSVLVAKILPTGKVTFSVLQHSDPKTPWNQYQPEQFTVFANNTIIK